MNLVDALAGDDDEEDGDEFGAERDPMAML